MTPEEARHLVVEGINYAAYHETDFSLHNSDKNRLFGSDHYESGRPVHEPSPWAAGDFEEMMAILLVWTNVLNSSGAAFTEAQKLLEGEDSVLRPSFVVQSIGKPQILHREPNSAALVPDCVA
jgi:hypothetical protein